MPEPNKRTPTMFMMAFTWLTFMVVLATYTSNLIAFLTVSIEKLPVNSLQELAEQDTHDVGLLGASAHELLFRVRINEVVITIPMKSI